MQHLWSIVYVPQVGYLVQVMGSPLGAEILDVLDDYEQVDHSTSTWLMHLLCFSPLRAQQMTVPPLTTTRLTVQMP